MPSASEVAAFRRAQAAVSAAARGNLLSFWAGLDQWEIVQVREALQDFFPALVEQYGNAQAALAAAWFEQLTDHPAVLGEAADEIRANARMRWALGSILKGNPAQALSTLGVVLDELVKQPGRDTIRLSAADAGIAYARVPSGSETCSFCLMLASRGAVYESRKTARGLGGKYHGDCDCVATPIRDESDLPAGYDPDELSLRYVEARKAANSGSPEKILAEWREREDIH